MQTFWRFDRCSVHWRRWRLGWTMSRHEGETSDTLVIGLGPVQLQILGEKYPIETGSYDENEFSAPASPPPDAGLADAVEANEPKEAETAKPGAALPRQAESP